MKLIYQFNQSNKNQVLILIQITAPNAVTIRTTKIINKIKPIELKGLSIKIEATSRMMNPLMMKFAINLIDFVISFIFIPPL